MSAFYTLYEDNGDFKVGTILSETDASIALESQHGKRAKIKSSHALLRFREPALGEFIPRAQALADEIDTDFLWEASGEAEFGFNELAREYFGGTPTPVEAAAVLFKLHAAPMYFYRKGRGRYKAAPPDTLRAALAGLEKKRLQAEQIARWVVELERFELPAELRPHLPELLYKPDRSRIETRAVEQACTATGLSSAKLLERCGAFPSSYDYHLGRFLFEHFPRGTEVRGDLRFETPRDLAPADVVAFSLDDAATTEIDDAFSLRHVDGLLRVGIHIAAPACGFRPDDPIDEIARARLSTVYMPGYKITMLPDDVVSAFTLAAGYARPALSLYVDVDPVDFSIRAADTRLESVTVTANLRHQDVDHLNALFALTEPPVESPAAAPFEPELRVLHRFALALEAARGQAGQIFDRPEYLFKLDGERITIIERQRGSPLDRLVAELMILVNRSWGRLLADHAVAAIYRTQSQGKVRMSTAPGEHQGLGVSHYAWSSSPLRRYIDLINQWQLIALLRHKPPPFAANSASLLGAIRDFETTYAAYAEFQDRMERYWCLRWLLQENVNEIEAIVVRENVVKFRDLPLYVRIPSLPAPSSDNLVPGSRVLVEVSRVDLIDSSLDAVYKARL